MLEEITKVDFSAINGFKGYRSFKPAFLYLKERKQLLKIDRWQDVMKILFFFTYKTANGKDAIDRWVNKSNLLGPDYLISNEREKIFNAIGSKITEAVKFSGEPNPLYIATNLEFPYNNLRIIQGLLDATELPSFELYVCPNILNETDDSYDAFLKEQKKKRRKPIRSSYLLSCINREILNKEELLFLRIEREFHKCAFIGDITVNDEELEIIKNYVVSQIKKLSCGESIENNIVFIYGLVLFAQRKYKDGIFWPVLGEIVGYTPAISVQTQILDVMKNTLTSATKYYLENGTNKFQNLCMHSFVTTPAANDLFDYLFTFWKIDLQRNIDNLYGDDGKDIFDTLIEKIKQNKTGKPVNGLLVHTSLALLANPVGSKNRLRNYLKLIDRWFWDEDSLRKYHSDNRILSLMRNWALNPNSAFQRSFKSGGKRRLTKGERVHSKPILHCVVKEGKFYLSLQRQLLKEEPINDVIWTITTYSETQTVAPEIIKNGKLGYYSVESFTPISEKDIFHRISFSLSDGKCTYYEGFIKENEIRVLDESGKSIDLENGFIQKGTYLILSSNGDVSIVGKHINQTKTDSFSCCYTKLDDGDILISSSGKAYLVGTNVKEGLIGERNKTIHVENEDGSYPIYTQSPSYLLRINESDLRGSYLRYDGKNYRLSGIKFEKIHFDNDAVDSYAILFNLSQFELKDGLNRFLIGLPGNSKKEIAFFLLKDFVFSFENAPYIFVSVGKLTFSKTSYIDTRGDCFKHSLNQETLSFSLDEKNISNNDVVTNKCIKLPITCNDFKGKICFKIPALYWGYNENDIKNFDRPQDISLKSMPENLYISNQFPYGIQEMDLEDSDIVIKPEQNKESDFIKLRIGYIKSENEIDKSKERRFLSLRCDCNKTISLMSILMRSIVKSKMIFGDFITNTIQGNVEIEGDGPYSVTIYDISGSPVAEDIPIENGHFECQFKSLRQFYKIQIFEIEENDFGFDGVATPLLKEPYFLELIDITHLEGKTATITNIQKGIFKPITFKKPIVYTLKEFKKVDIDSLLFGKIDITGVEEDIGPLSEKQSIAYVCRLFSNICETERPVCNCMLIYPNKNEASHYFLLRQDISKYGIDYQEMILDFRKQILMPCEPMGLSTIEKLDFMQTLFLSDWHFHIHC